MSARTVKAAAYEHLQHVDHTDEVTGRRICLPYETILQKIMEEFPGALTSEKCLRWYSVKLNEDGVKMPVRPRRPPRRKGRT